MVRRTGQLIPKITSGEVLCLVLQELMGVLLLAEEHNLGVEMRPVLPCPTHPRLLVSLAVCSQPSHAPND